MNTRFVDTNILIEAYLRVGEKSKNSQKLLKSAKNLITSWLVMGEFEWVLRSVYELKRNEIAELMSSITGLSSLNISNKKLLIKALSYFKNTNNDWTDCLNAVIAEIETAGEIYSYDRDYDKFPGIKRLEP